MNRATRRKLSMSAWLVLAAMLLTGLVTGGFCYAGHCQRSPSCWVIGIAFGVVINWRVIRTLNRYWEV